MQGLEPEIRLQTANINNLIGSSGCFQTFLSRMAFRTPVLHILNNCANCLVYNWVQPDPSILQKCDRCKIVKYCGKDCQVRVRKCNTIAFKDHILQFSARWSTGRPATRSTARSLWPPRRLGGRGTFQSALDHIRSGNFFRFSLSPFN